MKDQLNNNSDNNIQGRVEFGSEFGDMNSNKIIETLEMNKKQKNNKSNKSDKKR